MTQETLTTFFGWMTVLNIGFLAFTSIAMVTMMDWVTGIHGRMFRMEPADVRAAYFRYLAQYKVMTFIFALGPYLALRLM
ncbi:DUF6868 family protein [Phaeobacter marinintestinus]|uniref:DUF6868 family protein n=1 Tax=Falsiphaeobacter marinintestinus TaxID=1492905 RepID=UPI0011B54CF1|nr:hypothetical protein [Phaeobacter marinintestinus]